MPSCQQKEDAWNAIISGFMTGGNFGIWSSMFSTFDYTVKAGNKRRMHGMLSSKGL